ncbi:3-hydroxyacyl-CoA dehydrogenase NAD-binding domain-containing protein [Brevibacterium sp. CS2]|uniref:3-hydroxyacyl-CoA dehydrogenase NAD-binding domain-containing protein n=1 Tax=Brevibacterium sp. CS2 TaxID=2575923 RepID=UPI0010C79359|nr:3-hydroxyacyl-CoA dehydrogenase NAD-binding domain-containing protein [Brevibacterium sp. CS2]QCP04440.1 3-hydroxyacyl-CoA dehydrogenase [Brevibacterium sp. CS2]
MKQINEVVTLSIEDGIAVLTLDSPPVNALSAAVRAGLQQGFTAAIDDDAVQAIVLICAGRTFIAGADISEFGGDKTEQTGPDEREIMDNSPKPIVAAIHGTALGGGLETALCAHYRVAAQSAKVGLPEVHLGLLPGAGGTQRLPRLTGAEVALDWMITGRHVPVAEAAEYGVVDEVVPDESLREDAIAFARRVVAEGGELRRVRDRDDKVAADRDKPELFADFRKKHARKFRGFKAPEAIVQCVEAAVNRPFDEGREVEKTLFAELVSSPESAAQRYYFFAERAAAKVPDVPRDTPRIPVESVGIIGAGTMGGGIAMNFANAGIPVTIVEQQPEALERGLGVIRKNYERTASKGRITSAQVEERMGLITGSLTKDDLASVDLVIEAVFELMDVKKSIFTELDAICKPGAILATNTSGLDIDEIAAVTERPEAVIGMHFFSPANVMKLLEVVRADHTSKEVIATVMALAKKIGKIPALVGVCPGFVGNRILYARRRESERLLMEGAMPWDIDTAVTNFGLPMGPYQMSDLAGLDIGWRKEESAGRTVREVLCEMDRRGQKTGAGYYDYDENRKATPSPVAAKIIEDFRAKEGVEPREISEEEIFERCTLPMINEGLHILEEGKAVRASDIDVIYVNGYGWPVYRGGPMFYADQLGAEHVLERLRFYEEKYGSDFTPSPLLEKVVAEGGRISEL